MGRIHKFRGPILVTLGASLWATDSLFRAPVAKEYAPLFIVFMNHLLLLPPSLWLLGRNWTEVRSLNWRQCLALALIAGGGSVLATVAFTQAFVVAANYSVPVLIQKTQPCFALLLARIILGESLPRRFWQLALLALGGAYLLSFGTTSPMAIVSGQDLSAMSLALLAAATWGSCTVLGRLVVRELSFSTVTAIRFVLGSVCAAAGLAVSSDWSQLRQGFTTLIPSHWSPFIGMAYVSGLIPMLIYYRGLKTTPASIATLCELSFPVLAVALNWSLLGSALNLSQLLGAGLVVFAITALVRKS